MKKKLNWFEARLILITIEIVSVLLTDKRFFPFIVLFLNLSPNFEGKFQVFS